MRRRTGRVPRPHLGELAYQEYCRYLDAAQPAWETLPVIVRLAWGMAVKVAVAAALTVPWRREVKVARKPGKRVARKGGKVRAA